MKALFAGSFNPFTIGHYDIALRALRCCDSLVIAVGRNIRKDEQTDEQLARIRSYFADRPNVEVIAYEGLTTEVARRVGADVLVRGIRNVKDMEYEREMAAANFRLAGIDTILLFTQPEYQHISSSLVRELQHYGQDVSQLLPHVQN